MYLIYYKINGTKNWYTAHKREDLEELEQMLIKSLGGELGPEDILEIVDLNRTDLVEELVETKNKLKEIQKILNA